MKRLRFLSIRKTAFVLPIAMLVMALVFVPPTQAGVRCSEVFRQTGSANRSILAKMQERHRVSGDLFINQKDMRARPEKGGSCGPTCAVNLLQGLRESVGLYLDTEPYAVIRQLFTKMPELNQGNVTPQSMHEVIEFLIKTRMNGVSVTQRTEMIDGLGYSRFLWKDVRMVKALTVEMVLPRANEYKILFFGIKKPDGSSAGGHYVLVRDSMGHKIEVIDPNGPENSMQFSLQPVVRNNTVNTVELLPEPGNPFYDHVAPGTKFILYSIFTTEHE